MLLPGTEYLKRPTHPDLTEALDRTGHDPAVLADLAVAGEALALEHGRGTVVEERGADFAAFGHFRVALNRTAAEAG